MTTIISIERLLMIDRQTPRILFTKQEEKTMELEKKQKMADNGYQ